MGKNTGRKIQKPLTLKLDGELSILQFRTAVDAFFELAQNVASEFASDRSDVKWTVAVREGSAIIELRPHSPTLPPERLQGVVGAIENGLKDLERGEKKRPEFFTDQALLNAKKLAKVAGEQLFVSVKTPRTERRVSSQVVATVDKHLEPTYKDFGTLEGTLQIVSAADAGLEFRLLDPILGLRIRCIVNEEMEQRVLGAFRKRVRVWGLIRYRSDGTPVSIQVENFEVMRLNSDLPTIDDIIGILADDVKGK
jgi:hypothetical protein